MKKLWLKTRRAYWESWLESYRSMVNDPENAARYAVNPVWLGLIFPTAALLLFLFTLELTLAYFANIPQPFTRSFTAAPAVILPFLLFISYAAHMLGTFNLGGTINRITINKKIAKLEIKLKALENA